MKTIVELAMEVIAESGEEALYYKDITKRIMDKYKGRIKGKTPWNTVNRDMNLASEYFTFYRGGYKGLTELGKEKMGMKVGRKVEINLSVIEKR